MKLRILTRALAAAGALLAGLGFSADAAAQSQRALDARVKEVIDHWTPERRAAAIPRHLVIDERGLGYMRGANGGLEPYGHDVAAQAGPGGGGDSTGPSVSLGTPANGATINTASVTFTATVSDTSGVKSVSMGVRKGTGLVQNFTMNPTGGGGYGITLNGFTDGGWSWNVTAKDNAKPSNTTVSGTRTFTIAIGGGGGDPPPDGTVENAQLTSNGTVRYAVGRIYFEMPANARKTKWNGYVCSGTAVSDDGTGGRSTILTASHCVYDDANKAFARRVMFIPDQADTTGTGTDRDCSNDPIGCWVPTLGVVDRNWTSRTFPDNVAWDYAFYVVGDNAHQGNAASNNVLDAAVAVMSMSFDPVNTNLGQSGSLSHAIGYSYSEDPKLMYCSERMEDLDSANYWLGHCGLSGGSSGGPWSQPFDMTTGDGPIISVNSWGYTNQPGMAGPKLFGTSAACVFAVAKSTSIAGSFSDGNAGAIADCGT